MGFVILYYKFEISRIKFKVQRTCIFDDVMIQIVEDIEGFNPEFPDLSSLNGVSFFAQNPTNLGQIFLPIPGEA